MAVRRRMIIKQRTVPHAKRKKRRYRDETRDLGLDTESSRFVGRLTSEINSANGPLQLAQLVQEHGTRFSGTQVTMALSRLAAFATLPDQSAEQRAAHTRVTRRCMLLLRQKMADCDVLSYARASYSLGRLGLYDADLASALVDESYERLNLFSPDGLAALVSGLAALGHSPPEGWLDRFCLEVYTRFTRFSTQELASMLYALARLRHRPSAAWAQRCLEVFRAAAALPATAITPPALVKFAFAVASLQIRPSFNWTTALVARSRPHLDALNARELALLLWALARMLAPPSSSPTAAPAPATTAAAQPRLPQDGAPISGAAAALVGRQPGSGGETSPDAATAAAVAAPSGVAAGVAEAAGLDRTFLDAWFRCSARRMGSASAASLVLAVQALAALQVMPLPAKFIAALLEQLRLALPHPAPPAAGPGSAGPPLQQQRQGAGGRAEAEAEAGRLGGVEVVSVLLSVVALRVRPGPEWMDACMAALQPLLGTLEAPVLCDLAWALARLQYQPSPAWLSAFFARCRTVRHPDYSGLGPQQLGLLAWALRQMEAKPPSALRKLLAPHRGDVAAAEPAADAPLPDTAVPAAAVPAAASGPPSTQAAARGRPALRPGGGKGRGEGAGGAGEPEREAREGANAEGLSAAAADSLQGKLAALMAGGL